jgi:hypothetical protein
MYVSTKPKKEWIKIEQLHWTTQPKEDLKKKWDEIMIAFPTQFPPESAPKLHKVALKATSITFIDRHPWEALRCSWVSPKYKKVAVSIVADMEAKDPSEYIHESPQYNLGFMCEVVG